MHLHEEKESIMQNAYQLKDTGYYINEEDFNKVALIIRVELWDEVKQLRGEGFFGVINVIEL